MTTRIALWCLAFTAISLALAGTGQTQELSGCTEPGSLRTDSVRRWPAPLDRTVSLRVRGVSLRDALDRLAATANLRISYSAEFLPLDRRVCIPQDRVTVGDALAELLRATTLEAVVAGTDHVVLAPAPRTPGTEAVPSREDRVVPLEEIVVTGSAAGAPQRQLPVALNTLTHAHLVQQGSTRLLQALNAAVPGMWAWERSPARGRYGSIRGASSIGVSYPKIYIDGIEVANPLLISHMNPDAVERIEVIRGPQGAALYGTDAISGVISIITRHESVDAGAPRVRVRGRVGLSESEFTEQPAYVQDHALTLRGGPNPRSLGLSLAVGSSGEFTPDSYSRHLIGNAGVRLVGPRSIVTGTARFFAEGGAVSINPIFREAVSVPGGSEFERLSRGWTVPQSSLQYTLGANLTFLPSGRWTHSAVVGIDGARVAGALDDHTAIPSITGFALGSAQGAGDRGTLRVSSVARFGVADLASATITLVAEHSTLRENTGHSVLAAIPLPGGIPFIPDVESSEWRRNTGVVAQTNLALRDRVYVTGGVRVEKHGGFTGENPYAVLPMLGGAVVSDYGDVTVKLRGAYGKGIRPQRTSARQMSWVGIQPSALRTDLGPEEQSGLEGGIDLLVGHAFTLQVTRYDQLASGSIQRVFVVPDEPRKIRFGSRIVPFELQNVGEIANRGWEIQGSVGIGRLLLTGGGATTDSRVRRLTSGYTGDLQPGDRVLEVPARTASFTAAWSESRWSGLLSASRAEDWINYDRVAIVEDLKHTLTLSVPSLSDTAGARLRSYRRQFNGSTHLRVAVEREIRPGISAAVRGDNLLNKQRGEPDNMVALPGRTISLGVRVAF